MVDANNASVGNPVWAIGPQYCVPYNVELVIDRKPMHRIKFMVTDVQGNLLFKVKRHLLRLHDQGVLIDSVGNHVVTLRRKIMTAHHRWEVHRGDSTSNPILSVKTSAAIQLQTKLQVFKANKAEEICDFRVEGSWSESSYVIYAGESSTIIAQSESDELAGCLRELLRSSVDQDEMHKKRSVESVLLGKDRLMVTVHPNVDYALVVSLFVILDEIIN